MLTSSDCLKRFGMPSPTLAWEGKHLVSWDVPQSINDAIPALPNRIYCNKLLVQPLEKAFRNLIARGLHNELKTWDGCYNIRKKRGKDSWSLHSWAVAIDVNAAWNPFGGKSTLSPGFVQCFIDAGFDWGGYWKGEDEDGMHFQLQKI